jgi:hypothetical protein
MKNTFCKDRILSKIEKLKSRINGVRSEYLVSEGLQVFFFLSVIEGLETELFSLTNKLSQAV